MIVVGTAGHIDHGKSAIVKRLTGHDPDRLPEEKARGMTIDLGFAFMPTDSGDEIAFIDVPGHERFVRNMISGAGGIDLVMLVIAADDGWMPQSEEHFQIIRLLGITRGMIVINKVDLVDDDWLVLLEDEIRQRVAGSFLEDAPLFKVSAQDGRGFDQLSEYLRGLTSDDRANRDIGKARLYVDRAFMRTGIGRVVAGTLRDGNLTLGQQVMIWPGEEQTKIRSLQTNGREVEQATPGQRTAVTLSGVDRENLFRGAVLTDLATLSHFHENPVLALSLELLADSPVSIKDRRRSLLIVGTTETEGEIRLLDNREISPGKSSIVFFKPDEPVLSLIGDHFIMRLPTPMVTLGGGIVIDHMKRFPRKKDSEHYAYLEQRRSGRIEDIIRSELASRTILPGNELMKYSHFSVEEVQAGLNKAIESGEAGRKEGLVFGVSALNASAERVVEQIGAQLKSKPHLKGLSLAEISRLVSQNEAEVQLVLDYLISDGRVVKLVDKYNLIGRGMSLAGDVKAAHQKIMKFLEAEPYAPPRLPDLAAEGKSYREAIRFIIESGQGYKCGTEFVYLSSAWNDIVEFVRQRLETDGELTVGELRDRFGFSRKFAIPILEETDRLKITERDGDRRVKGARFEKA